MLQTTQGIVIHHIKYSETSVIAKIFTEKFGLQSYILKGVRKRKSKIKTNLLQSLSLVELSVYQKENRNINNIREIKSLYNFSKIPFDIVRSSIVLFIAEVLYKSIREEERNTQLFEFLINSIKFLDISEEKVTNFHLVFLLHFSKYIGFFPRTNYNSQNIYFDLFAGHYKNQKPDHNNFIEPPLSLIFNSLLTLQYENLNKIELNNKGRNELLEKILIFYSFHLDSFKEIKSLEVLRQVFS